VTGHESENGSEAQMVNERDASLLSMGSLALSGEKGMEEGPNMSWQVRAPVTLNAQLALDGSMMAKQIQFE